MIKVIGYFADHIVSRVFDDVYDAIEWIQK